MEDMSEAQIALLQSIADNPKTLSDVREAVLLAIKHIRRLEQIMSDWEDRRMD